jgi:putative membrane protein
MAWLWFKTLHLVFVVTWFAGLFYLPRLFVYHAQTHDPALRAQFTLMERRLLVITHLGGGLALGFGLATLWRVPAYWEQTWLHAKLGLVLGLVVYHGYLVRLARAFRAERIPHSARFLRVFNEIPALLLLAIVALAVFKPR